jgi:hypothetical protein
VDAEDSTENLSPELKDLADALPPVFGLAHLAEVTSIPVRTWRARIAAGRLKTAGKDGHFVMLSRRGVLDYYARCGLGAE